MKRQGDKGSSCLTPLEGWKKYVDSPLIRIANSEVDKQESIMCMSFMLEY